MPENFPNIFGDLDFIVGRQAILSGFYVYNVFFYV